MEVKLHYFHGHGSTTAVAVKIFLPLLIEFGNSKLFELYLIFHYGTTTAVKTKGFTSVNVVVLRLYQQMIWRICIQH